MSNALEHPCKIDRFVYSVGGKFLKLGGGNEADMFVVLRAEVRLRRWTAAAMS
jgi:hypothetical protein